MKRVALLTLAGMLSLSLAISPVFMADTAFAAETGSADSVESGEVQASAEGTPFEGLAGKSVDEVKADPDISYVLDDPIFYEYFEVDANGIIKEKTVNTNEVDQFIADMDKNAEGIDDDTIVEMDEDMSCMGCGVSGLGMAQVPSKYATYGKSNCIDISYWQGKVSDANWAKIKAAGVTHAIIRCGYSKLSGGAHCIDSTFANNINGAYNAGIKVGVYYYSTATTAAEAMSEAQYVATLLSAYKSKISLPVAYDYETGGRLTASVMKKNGTASCTAFCDYISSAGYTPMVYANYTTLCNYISYPTLEGKYKIWLANYTTNGTATTYPGSYCMWQYSSSGKVNGLSGSIDMNYVFENGQNGSATTTPAPAVSTPAAAPSGYKGIVTSNLNYRSGPGTNYKKKGTYKSGTAVYFSKFKGNWAKLTNGYWISRSYVKYVAKTTASLNYRSGPGTKYKKKGTYSKGNLITVVSVRNGWARLSNGYYVSTKHITKQKW